jgi:type III secretion protein R
MNSRGCGSRLAGGGVLLSAIFAVGPAFAAGDPAGAGDPVSMLLLIAGLTLLPFALVLTTSFIKFVVTLSILRNAVGTPQIPPTIVVTSLALLLTAYVMAPTAAQVYDEARAVLPAGAGDDSKLLSIASARQLLAVADRAKEPLRAFLLRQTDPKDLGLFMRLARRVWSKQKPDFDVQRNDFIVVIPAFVISQLAAAFKIGFLIFLPFLVIDMVVANVLLALGMHMLSPTTIALPFKLLLFVVVDGWQLIAQGLVLSFG